jgi:hypothetical protein
MRFGRFFGNKLGAPTPDPMDEDDDIPLASSQPIHGPPEFVRAAEMQRAYWTPNAETLAELEAHRVDQLDWRALLRLHHLICLQRLEPGVDREAVNEKCRQTVRRLLAGDSPYRPRPALVWQGQSPRADGDGEPDMEGDLLNASLTHLGCLEVYRIDAANRPTQIDFVGFDELTGVLFGPLNLIRVAKLFYEDGRQEMALVPLLYGLTWAIGNDHDRRGQMTRFVSQLESEEILPSWASGIGVGQQDLSIGTHDRGARMFGLGSVAEIVFPLDVRDPRFDEKARGRGLDPDELHRQMEGDIS